MLKPDCSKMETEAQGQGDNLCQRWDGHGWFIEDLVGGKGSEKAKRRNVWGILGKDP